MAKPVRHDREFQRLWHAWGTAARESGPRSVEAEVARRAFVEYDDRCLPVGRNMTAQILRSDLNAAPAPVSRQTETTEG